MRNSMKFSGLVMLALLLAANGSTQVRDYPIKPVPFTQIRLADEFWAARMRANAAVTVPHTFGKLRETGVIGNFALAAGLTSGEQCGNYPFDDSDVFKSLEAASYVYAQNHEAALKAVMDSVIASIAAAQEEDGYLYTARTSQTPRFPDFIGPSRWSNLSRSHELYNVGHLYEAAVAHFHATGERTLLDIALRNAELIAATFGPDKLRVPPGHQEIELGLVKLYRVTGEQKYLELAKFFLEERGQAHDGRKLYGEYSQDHLPIFEQAEAVGHAVRAPYMYTAMADVAALTGDPRYQPALERLWQNVIGKKLFVTGGLGSVSFGEGFGPNYDLPNMTAYNETCSGIANMLWHYRLFLLSGEGKYLDVFERTLYNAFLSGIALTGDRFFYDNPLASRGQHQRRAWFYCNCCPGNIARFIASLPQCFYGRQEGAISVNLYAAGEAQVALDGNNVRLSQTTRYPWDGQVAITVEPETPCEFAVRVRIPGWARNEAVPSDLYRFADHNDEMVALSVNGEPWPVVLDQGFVAIDRRWQSGDKISLNLPMPIRRLQAHANVKADAGRVALQRGPIVFCAEGHDNNDQVLNLVLRKDAPLQSHFDPDLLGGLQLLTGTVEATAYSPEMNGIEANEQPFIAIPYYAWAHRGPSEMAVWLAAVSESARPRGGPSFAATSKITSSGAENPAALNDGAAPQENSVDPGEAFVWTTIRDTVWAQYDLPQTEEVSEARVWWFDDGEAYRVPKSWRVLARFNGAWQRVWAENQPYGVERNRFNAIIFETVRTDALRLEVLPQSGYSAGVVEWQVF